MSDGQNEIDAARAGGRGPAAVRARRRAERLFVFRFAGESDVRWRAVNARDVDEARAQALILSNGELVDYGLVDIESGAIAVLGTIGSSLAAS